MNKICFIFFFCSFMYDNCNVTVIPYPQGSKCKKNRRKMFLLKTKFHDFRFLRREKKITFHENDVIFEFLIIFFLLQCQRERKRDDMLRDICFVKDNNNNGVEYQKKIIIIY